MNNGGEDTVALEWLDPGAPGGIAGADCGVARIRETGATAGDLRPGDWVLAPRRDGAAMPARLPASACIVLPEALPPERAIAVGALARALWIWDAADLELGETAVFAAAPAGDQMLAVVAGWRSGRDAIRLYATNAPPTLAGVLDLDTSDVEHTAAALATAMRAAPGTVAAVTSPRAEALDLLLESAPMWTRFVLASVAYEPATIDFYNNVHRKGCRLLSVPATPGEMLGPGWIHDARQHVARASRVLQSNRLAGALLA